MKPLRLAPWISILTFSIGLCCTRVWPILNPPQLGSMSIPAVRVPEQVVVSKMPLTEGEILKTVFRDQIDRCHRGQPKPAIFLSYNRRDLPDEFLSSFVSGAVLVQQGSQRRQFFLQTRELGILISVNEIEFTKPSVVQVRCECGRGGLDGYSYSLRLRRKNNIWAVERRKLIGFS